MKTNAVNPKLQERYVRAVAEVARNTAQKTLTKLAKESWFDDGIVKKMLDSASTGTLPSDGFWIEDNINQIAKYLAPRIALDTRRDRIKFIPATDGTRTIAKTKTVFHFPGDEFKTLKTSRVPTKKIPVDVYKGIRDGEIRQIFDFFNEDLERLCLTEDQIIQYAYNQWFERKKPRHLLFLLKVGKEVKVLLAGANSFNASAASLADLDSRSEVLLDYRYEVIVPRR